ncbi:LysR family transcriptional regulator [Rhizobium leguminosarum]|jgi:DNA-binding transcriptional LysR family regulator|uniref:LysR family transcriptional regulator n=1 Tax=Rhizobium leguminosarum TaxID=384 RepID=UPI001C92A36F|nr:LysR family transcriptional regulator [Rhizobium leguminosarum]MBY3043545.1 LysR family transcriptional regulator [Rhizobium leguminosarum]
MDVNLALRAFVRTVEKGSLTGAARDLGISQPAVTKHLRNLERHVNARLLERTTRGVRPTVHGSRLYEVSRNALASIEAALEGVRHDMGEIEGTLRLHAPSCIGAQHLHGMVMKFQNEHPAVTVDLVLDNRHVDLVYENFDLAVQYGKPEQQELIIRSIGSIRRVLVASPEYLKRVGPIDSLDRLSNVDMVTNTTILSPQHTLTLCKDGAMTEVSVRPSLRTNNAQVMINSLKSGHGAGPAQVILVSEELADGRLVRILPEYEVKPTDAYLTYPSTKFMRPVVRAFTDFVVPNLRSVEGID